MDNMLIAVFDTAPKALKGVIVLKELHRAGAIKLFATAVIAKDPTGEVSIKQASERELNGTHIGLLFGILFGVLGGPPGLVLAGLMGGLVGLIFDLAKAGISVDFLEEASKVLEPGKSVLLAEMEETSITPVDIRLAQLDGHVYRQSRSKFVNDQLLDELHTINVN